MNELKQIFKWGTWSLCGLVVLPLLISIADGLGVKFGFYFSFLPYVGTAYLLVLLAVIALIIICAIGILQNISKAQVHKLQKEALDDKLEREKKRI